MRVRQFELRLIAVTLSGLWAIAAALVLVGYRPGGPNDLLVGLVACLPVPIALGGLVWPPVARGERAYAAIVWLGLAAILILVPAVEGIVTQLLGRGPQTLVPSLEAAYPWVLALGATSTFSGLGIARRLLGVSSLRRARLLRGVFLGVVLTAAVSGLFAGVAVANDLALRDRPAIASRFGPTDASREPPACDDAIEAGPGARLELTLDADVDGRPVGSLVLNGARRGADFRWTADVAGTRLFGQIGQARIGREAWAKGPREAWHGTLELAVTDGDVDGQLVAIALAAPERTAAEERGLEFVEGARARHCRIAIDGPTFLAALPELASLVGKPDLHRWRGHLDYWVFVDGQVGQAEGSINGEASALDASGLQANLRATMIATDRDRPPSIEAPDR